MLIELTGVGFVEGPPLNGLMLTISGGRAL
jgi:hypothetical protein